MHAGGQVPIRRTGFLALPDSYVISSVLLLVLFRLQHLSRPSESVEKGHLALLSAWITDVQRS